MIKERLKDRTFLIKASPLPDRIKDSYNHRRDFAAIEMEKEEDFSDKYDTFFDYEDDLANLKASGEQYAQMIDHDPENIGILEERDDYEEGEEQGFDKEVCGTNPVVMVQREDLEKKGYTEVKGFEFIQCNFIKSDGKRCKRQSPKGGDICSVHRKYKEKHGL